MIFEIIGFTLMGIGLRNAVAYGLDELFERRFMNKKDPKPRFLKIKGVTHQMNRGTSMWISVCEEEARYPHRFRWSHAGPATCLGCIADESVSNEEAPGPKNEVLRLRQTAKMYSTFRAGFSLEALNRSAFYGEDWGPPHPRLRKVLGALLQ